MPCRGIDKYRIGTCLDHCFSALNVVRANPDCRSHHQLAIVIFGCVEVLLALLDILRGNHSSQLSFSIDQGKFFNPVLIQQPLGIFLIRVHRRRHQFFARRHHIADCFGRLLNNPNITARDHPDETSLSINHRESIHAPLIHNPLEIK